MGQYCWGSRSRFLGGSGYSGSYSSYSNYSGSYTSSCLQQVEHKHSRPQRARRRPQRTRAVAWQRGRDADQGGRPHPRALAAAEERHRNL